MFAGGITCAWGFSRLVRWVKKNLRRRYEPERATKYTCEDGHIVRSRGELVIDNYFSSRQIAHVYEKSIQIRGGTIKYDWYLPELETYVEYWGYGGKAYMERKKEKIRLYRRNGLKLLSIEDKHLEDIYTYLKRILKSSKQFSQDQTPSISFCPNCGKRLDTRFSSRTHETKNPTNLCLYE